MPFKGKPCIYKIVNLIDGKMYIGSAINHAARENNHFTQLLAQKHRNSLLQKAYNKHGREAFQFEAIEWCDKEVLREREQYYLDYFKTYERGIGYNLATNAERTRFGAKLTPEQLERHKKVRIGLLAGDKHPSYNPEKLRFVKKDGTEIICTRFEFCRINGIPNKNLTHLVSGRYLSLCGWFLNEVKRRTYKRAKENVVINTNTGIYYPSIREAAESLNLHPSFMSRVLHGEKPNSTGYMLC